MRKALLVTAALVVAVIFFAAATLPDRPRPVEAAVDADVQRRTVAGAYHVHSNRSDGAGDKDAIAAAASRAGLTFVILTDHGDGTRAADPPVFLHGVLCIDAVEISSDGGHYVALDMAASPFPLGGEPSAVVEDVHRLGGFGIAAHPDSPRAELAWTDGRAPIDGLEWINADSEWRNDTAASLARVLFDYPMRPAPALALLLDRPVATLRRWDSAGRPMVALAAHDAHGGFGRGIEGGGARRAAWGGIPSYEASFRTFSTRAILDRPMDAGAAGAARQVLDAIEHGRVFTVVDAVASPGFVDFTARAGTDGPKVGMGATLPAGPATISVDVAMPSGAELALVGKDGDFQRSTQPRLVVPLASASGPFRVEVRVPGAPGRPPVPWLLTNAIDFTGPPASAAGPPADVEVLSLPPGSGWHVEKDASTRADVTARVGDVTLDYALAPGARASQFAALATNISVPAPGFSRIRFTAAATRAARVSAQLRYRDGGVRWRTSFFVDSTPREVLLSIGDFVPADRQPGPAPDPVGAESLLFVVDLTHARPGDRGGFTIGNVRFAR